MFRRHWSTITQVGLISFAIAAILAAAVFAIYQANLARITYGNEAAAAANRNSYRSREQMYRDCIKGAPKEKHDCIEQVRDTDREYRREERDLEAQLTTATWTAYMGGAAIMGMALSLIGVILVFVTFRATKRGADVAQNTYRAFIAIERARLVVSIGQVMKSSSPSNKVDVIMQVTNIGKAPCVVTGIYWAWRKSAEPGVGIFNGPPRSELVPPSGKVNLGLINIADYTAQPFLCGVVRYTSPLSDDHCSFFCFEITPGHRPDHTNQKSTDWPEDR